MKHLPLLIVFLLLAGIVLASSDDDADKVAEGGRLYDKWWAEYDLRKPGTTHPSYPKTGKKKGATTWRCKECHGWDYKGVAGAYSKGSHYTGIKGIRAYAGRPVSDIVSVLKNKTHRYDRVMLDHGLKRIALFVSKGQVDIAAYVGKGKKVRGNVRRGKKIYNKWCEECHGDDGREINFKSDDNPEYLGTVARKNPWEAMHKLRNGQPDGYVMGDPMPHMNDKLDLKGQLDLLRFLQTLPVEKADKRNGHGHMRMHRR